MPVFTIEKKHFDEKGHYVGPDKISNFDGDVHVEGGLGCVRFLCNVNVVGDFTAGEGTDIIATNYLSAGGDIKIEGGLNSGRSIYAGGDIVTKKVLFADNEISAGGKIESKNASILVNGTLTANGPISAKQKVAAGGYIISKTSVSAGHFITAEKKVMLK